MEKPITEKPVIGARKMQLMLEDYIGNEQAIRKNLYVSDVDLGLRISFN